MPRKTTMMGLACLAGVLLLMGLAIFYRHPDEIGAVNTKVFGASLLLEAPDWQGVVLAKPGAGRTWTPALADALSAEKLMRRYIRRESPEIYRELARYRRQFIGTNTYPGRSGSGGKILKITCFIMPPASDRKPPDWRRNEMTNPRADKGYFQIWINPQGQEVVWFVQS